MHTTFTVRTSSRTTMVNITRDVERAASELGVKDGALLVYCPHTTGAITINESADPAVVTDIDSKLCRVAPHSDGYRHSEGNSDAHVKSSLVGCSETVLVSNGALVLGRWQGVFFCEFDGPRTRSVIVGTLGSAD